MDEYNFVPCLDFRGYFFLGNDYLKTHNSPISQFELLMQNRVIVIKQHVRHF